jgi:hypothetical protein
MTCSPGDGEPVVAQVEVVRQRVAMPPGSHDARGPTRQCSLRCGTSPTRPPGRRTQRPAGDGRTCSRQSNGPPALPRRVDGQERRANVGGDSANVFGSLPANCRGSATGTARRRAPRRGIVTVHTEQRLLYCGKSMNSSEYDQADTVSTSKINTPRRPARRGFNAHYSGFGGLPCGCQQITQPLDSILEPFSNRAR